MSAVAVMEVITESSSQQETLEVSIIGLHIAENAQYSSYRFRPQNYQQFVLFTL